MSAPRPARCCECDRVLHVFGPEDEDDLVCSACADSLAEADAGVMAQRQRDDARMQEASEAALRG